MILSWDILPVIHKPHTSICDRFKKKKIKKVSGEN